MVFDYNRSTLNMMSSILGNFGGKSPHLSLPALDELTREPYDHVILMVFDGMGQSFVERYARELNLPPKMQNIPLKTVFPPTTAAAMTSLYTGDSPREHGYLGWSLWFEEFEDRYINILPGTESGKNRAYFGEPRDIYDIMPLHPFSQKLRDVQPDLPLYFITPKAFKESRYTKAACGPAKMVPYRRFKDMTRAAAASVKKNSSGRSYTMVYNVDPDKFLHPEGVDTLRLRDFMTLLGEQLRKLISRIEGSNTLLLVTADHGMTGMEDYYKMKEGEELFSLLKRPPFPESRMLSFHVKEGDKERFRKRFHELLGEDFTLIEGEAFIREGWLGPDVVGGQSHGRLDKLIGDYMAVAKGRKGIKYEAKEGGKSSPLFKAHHAGMTREEMDVPLLVYSAR
ncbi:MAG: alkaline phosphatase family protein [Spirochaetales bacterium]|nr:alkaline phosphatase family protein [Spirochaetales bacterium]